MRIVEKCVPPATSTTPPVQVNVSKNWDAVEVLNSVLYGDFWERLGQRVSQSGHTKAPSVGRGIGVQRHS